MRKPIYVLNGPNLNRLGMREPDIYGTTTLDEIETICRTAAEGHALVFRQTNAEHILIEWVHEAIGAASALVVNPAALTFTSIAVLDALKMFPGPIVELHISNIHRREAIYRVSLVSPIATGIVAGLGADGYRVAVSAALRLIASGQRTGGSAPAAGSGR